MTGQISRLEWWISVTLVVLVIVVHALVPHYEYQLAGAGGLGWVRVDRWTGQAIFVTPVNTDGIMILRAPLRTP